MKNARRRVCLIVVGVVVGLWSALGVQGWTRPHLDADFNGDGFDDLAIAVEEGGSSPCQGAVHIIYGSAAGLHATSGLPNQLLASGDLGCSFGEALATGDFDKDGFSDLAIGVPKHGSGAVKILYGSLFGLKSSGSQLWDEPSVGIRPTGSGSRYGDALATGDFNSDGFFDLAIGAPGRDIGGVSEAGAVNVLYGSAFGLTASGYSWWHQSTPTIGGAPEVNDFFGADLAAGDFNNDGFFDLAIGVPNDAVGIVNNAGGVQVLSGSALGLTALGSQLWNQGPVGGTPEEADFFGTALAAGDFNKDGFFDLAIGVPGDSVGTINAAGAVNVLYGSALGLKVSGNQLWNQASFAIGGTPELNDYFGTALAAGDFNKDGFFDLAIGVPGDSVATINNAGAVNVLYGATLALTATGNQLWNQASSGIPDAPEIADFFGKSLGAPF